MMPFEPGKRVGDGLDGRRVRQIRALDHDHGRDNARAASSLAAAPAPPSSCDDDVHRTRFEQRALVREVERPARGDQLDARGRSLGEGASTLRTI